MNNPEIWFISLAILYYSHMYDERDIPVLTPELAQQIAIDIGRITGFNVLITDRQAVVIGCGDQGRIGTVHEASHEVLRTRQAKTHTAGQARRLRGVKPGISLPIIVGAEAIGTVCLTGSPEEVRRFGLVVQRQTELLLEEAALLRSRLLHEQAVDDFLRDIALHDPEVMDPDTLQGRAAALGLTLARAHTAVVLDVRAGQHGTAAVSRISLLRTVREFFGSSQDLAGEITAGRYAVLHATDTVSGELTGRCQLLADLIRQRHGLDTRIAAGGPAAGLAGMHSSYRHAAAALRIGPMLDPDARVFAVADLRVPQLVAAAARQERSEFAASVLGGLRDRADWPTLRETLIAWSEGGFNLLRAAERLHVHRNTLLYRLGKIEQLSARQMREPTQAIAMYLAALADLLDSPPGKIRT
jgi:carbohydrate diacid regulator